ncbi:3'-5' exonuclease family protein [Cupriavidus pinatubonensis]|uniref:3'-5' exonuclease family protein n=1 Tax=Cupriavidus pinatubonensis TaxID=248026 RepID=UPI00112AB980|nr:3'-5' exonuclease family protein [Cupriavidus pinatubonensis]TPQ44290.1 ethanolamine utilization protein [Cupriavidus pinatubonensis]
MQDIFPPPSDRHSGKARFADAHALAAALSRPIVFVDLETTGADAQHDRITEIGVVEVGPEGIQEWDTLLDPGVSIPPFIQRLTGITDETVQGQPTFASIAEALAERLQGRLFVAHNARFDYGFLKNEFRRAGLTFRADVLCTVRLSRSLFPSAARHGLDAIIARFDLQPRARHRALADAELLWQFWQKIHALYSVELIDAATGALVKRASLPAGLEETALDDVPDTAGVYLFYGDNDAPLYIGKSVHLRQRIGAHFSGDYRLGKDMRLARLVRRVEWRETGGEIGALLLEASLVKTMQPLHNQMLRGSARLYTWELPPELPVPRLRSDADTDFSRRGNLYGAFASRGAAQAWLRRLADEHRLCQATLTLEKTARAGNPCFARQLHRCEGACVGEEASPSHRARIATAMAEARLKRWPFDGPAAWPEVSGTQTWWHVAEDWCYLGSVQTLEDVTTLLAAPARFDLDTYQILASRLQQWMPNAVPLTSTRSFELALCEAPAPDDRSPPNLPQGPGRSKAPVRRQPSPGLFDD